MTRSTRSAWNFLTTIAFSAITMVVALVATPLLLHELGPARLGASRAVADWVGYLTLLELGLNGAVIPLLSQALGTANLSEVKTLMAGGFRAYLLVTCLMLLGALLLGLSITRLVNVGPSLHSDLRLATFLAAIPLLLMPLSPLKALAEASQRSYVLTFFLMGQSLIVAVSAVLLAHAGFGIAGQSLAAALGALFFGALLVIDARRHSRQLLPSNPLRADRESSRRIWALNTPALVMTVCNRLGLLTDNIVIGSILSAKMIVPFLMTQRLGQIAQAQLNSVGSASWAGLIELHVRGEKELFRARFLELNQFVTALGLSVLIPIVAYNHYFVRLWLGEAMYGGFVLTFLGAGNALILGLTSLWGWPFGGTGQIARLVPLVTASAVLNVLVSIGFTSVMAHYGATDRALWGPVLGTTAAQVMINLPLMPRMLRSHFGVSVRGLMRALGGPIILGIPYSVGLFWIAQRLPPASWVSLGTYMGTAALVFGGLCWAMLLSSDDRSRWLARVRLVVGPK